MRSQARLLRRVQEERGSWEWSGIGLTGSGKSVVAVHVWTVWTVIDLIPVCSICL